MTDKETAVIEFLAGWSVGDARTLADSFTEDAVVWNDMRNTVRGREAIHEHLKTHLSVISDCKIEVLAIASEGNMVFTERVDRMKVMGAPLELPVAGVFEVDDAGKLTAWRDYFDLNMVMDQLKASGVVVGDGSGA
jgi:limonene-1,2-epoxide hydrolase